MATQQGQMATQQGQSTVVQAHRDGLVQTNAELQATVAAMRKSNVELQATVAAMQTQPHSRQHSPASNLDTHTRAVFSFFFYH